MKEANVTRLEKLPIIKHFIHLLRSIKLPKLEGFSLYDLLYMYIKGIVNGAFSYHASAVAFSFFMALLPVLLITFAVIGNYLLPDFSFAVKFFKLKFIFSKQTLLLLGDPTIAMLVSVLSAIYFLGIRRGKTMPQMMQWLQDAISGIAMILLIITAGGVFKQVIIDSGTGKYITGFASQWNISPLIFAWVVTALLRVAIGSASVAGITAAGIVSPLLITTNVSPELLVLAVGTGSVFGSHINDSGFWMFKEFFKLSLKQTFLSWTVMETIISIIGLIGVLILNMII